MQASSVSTAISKCPLPACPGVVDEEGFPFWTEGDRGECPSWLMVAFGAVGQNIPSGDGNVRNISAASL